MSMTKKILGLGAGIAAISASVPAAGQYYGSNYYYGYNRPYAYGVDTNQAASQCSAAVQNRLYNRTSIGGILGALLGSESNGRVLSVSQAYMRSDGTVRVRGYATSGRYASNGYGPYGMGAYGALGYGYRNAADLSFRCDVAPNGAVYNVSINRR